MAVTRKVGSSPRPLPAVAETVTRTSSPSTPMSTAAAAGATRAAADRATATGSPRRRPRPLPSGIDAPQLGQEYGHRRESGGNHEDQRREHDGELGGRHPAVAPAGHPCASARLTMAVSAASTVPLVTTL